MDYSLIFGLVAGFLIFILFLLCSVNGVIVWLLLKKIKDLKTYSEENTAEEVKALTAIITLLEKEFSSNATTHQEQIDWMATNLEKLSEHNSENIKFVIEQIFVQGRLINKLAAAFGYSPNTDDIREDNTK
jgi:cell division protein ZapA (FtsZ GTPase activity inhibitor)